MLVDDIIAAFDALKNGETKTGVPLHDAADRCEGAQCPALQAAPPVPPCSHPQDGNVMSQDP